MACVHASSGGTAEALARVPRREEEHALLSRPRSATPRRTGTEVELLALPYDAFRAPSSPPRFPDGQGPDVFIFNCTPTAAAAVSRGPHAPPSEGSILTTPPTGRPLSIQCPGAGRPHGWLSVISQVLGAVHANRQLLHTTPTDARRSGWRPCWAPLRPTRQGRFGLAYKSGEPYYHAAFLFGFGGELFDAREDKATFDTPAMARSLAFVKSLQDRRNGCPPGSLRGAGRDAVQRRPRGHGHRRSLARRRNLP